VRGVVGISIGIQKQKKSDNTFLDVDSSFCYLNETLFLMDFGIDNWEVV